VHFQVSTDSSFTTGTYTSINVTVQPNGGTQTFSLSSSSDGSQGGRFLPSGTAFFYRLVFQNTTNGEVIVGNTLSFTTLTTPVVTSAATLVTSSFATLNGTVNPNGSAGLVHFQVSADSSFSTGTYPTINVTVQPNGGTQAISISSSSDGSLGGRLLPSGTTFFYRLVFQNTTNGEVIVGNTLSFTTVTIGSPVGILTSSTSKLFFASQALNVTSGSQSVTLTNTGNATLTISSISLTGDFALTTDGTTTCSAALALAPNAECLIAITFAPSALSTRTGAIVITAANASNSPQSIALSGFGMQEFPQSGLPTSFDNGLCSTSKFGCALTSAASLLTTFDPTATPASLDAFLSAHSGYCASDCDLIWSVVPSLESPSTPIHLVGAPSILGGAGSQIAQNMVQTSPAQDLNTYLTSQIGTLENRVLLAMKYTLPNGDSGSHFVFVTRPTGSGDWDIYDPNNAIFGRHTLAEYLAGFSYTSPALGPDTQIRFSAARAVSYGPGAGSHLSIVACSPVELLVTDPNGLLVGNLGPGNEVIQIPFSSYGRDFPLGDDTGTGATIGDPAGTKSADIASPPEGIYTVVATGTNFGQYKLNFLFTASDGTLQQRSFAGFAAPGSTATFTADYSSTPGATVSAAQQPTGSQLGLSNANMTFSSQNVGTTSVVQSIGVADTGTSPLSITNIAITGPAGRDFALAAGTTCPAVGGSVGIGTSCTINVTFTPTVVGTRAATVTISDNAPGSPHVISLTGTATPGTPTITWATPPSIVYGTPLDTTQLNATASVPGTFVYNPPAGTLPNAGPQTLSVIFTPSDSNDYTATTDQVTLVVQPAKLTVSAGSLSRQYGQPNPALSSVTYSGFVNGDGPPSLSGALNCVTPAMESSPVGSYAVTCSGLSSRNYAITFTPGTLTITKAPLTISANDSTKILNAPNPTLTWTARGFVNGDTTNVLTASPTCSTTALPNSPAGSYPITCSGAAASNYTFSYLSGTFKIVYSTAIGHAILPPIALDGTSVFNQGRTIPAKFSVYDANGVSVGTPGVVSSFFLTAIQSVAVLNSVQDVVATNNPDTAFRWDSTSQQWVFNIATGNLSPGKTYIYTISLNDGSTITFQYNLR
jgi:MBG domain-containing protein/centrosomal CEP192-like protein